MRRIIQVTLPLLFLVSACGNKDKCYTYHYDWGFDYKVKPNIKTEYGIKVDTSGRSYPNEVFNLMDKMTKDTESCLDKKVDKKCLKVKIPSDWFVSEHTGHQLLKDKAPKDACSKKGLDPDKGCYWRAGLQDGYKVITTPNLYLYKDPLAKYITGSDRVWEEVPHCLKPNVEHDWMEQ